MKVNINNLTTRTFIETGLRSLFEKVITSENIGNDSSVTITFVGLARMRKLNRQYRKKDTPTDVLSFGEPNISWPTNDKSSIGELVICPQVVEKNAKQYGVTRSEELKRVVIHGVLHLLGYDHEKDMKLPDLTARLAESSAKRAGVSSPAPHREQNPAEAENLLRVHPQSHAHGFPRRGINDSQEEIYTRQEKYVKSASRLRLIK
ncbi:MAG: rRNA maturation RNase YbeY [bacterium]